ncbi:MAG: DUF6353 family protein [Lachnospiraceae bacterium]|nr:DUF6353 family protein [Lachnospiraceae bacterium]
MATKSTEMQRLLKRNSSTILTCIGAVGVVATAVSTALVTPKVTQKLSKTKKEKRRKLTKTETFLIAAPNYIPAVAIGAGTILCIFAANTLNQKHQAGLTSAYALLNESYKDYRKTLIDLHGEEIDEEVRQAMLRECCDYHQLHVDSPDNKAIFLEPISGETIEAYEREIMDAEYHMNRNYILRGYASLNEFYEFLGLPKTDYGDELGWCCMDEIDWIDFEHHEVSRDDGGTPIYEISYIFEPYAGYLGEFE